MVIAPGKKSAGDQRNKSIKGRQTTYSQQDLALTELVTRPGEATTESIFGNLTTIAACLLPDKKNLIRVILFVDYFYFNTTLGNFNETVPMCEEKPSTLVGKLKVLKEPLPWETIQKYIEVRIHTHIYST